MPKLISLEGGQVLASENAKGVTDIVVSNPPSGCYKITNIWRDKDGNLTYEFETEPEP